MRTATPRTSTIVMADDGVVFDGYSLRAGPLGGAESAFIGLADALAERGHIVHAFTRTGTAATVGEVRWAPFDSTWPQSCDLYIANRGTAVLDRMGMARRTAFWLHNPASYIKKWRYIRRVWRRKPVIVTAGLSHAGTVPRWMPGSRAIIPLGVDAAFLEVPPRDPPPPRAVFVSNPLRRLDWLLDLWARHIQPHVPAAELHIYSSLATYQGGLDSKEWQAAAVLSQAKGLADKGVVLHPPVSKHELAKAYADIRLFLHGGDTGETFCLAAAETQAAGIPGVVAGIASLPERIVDGETGFIIAADDRQQFAERAVALLKDDSLWRRQHEACLARRHSLSWAAVVPAWEALLP